MEKAGRVTHVQKRETRVLGDRERGEIIRRATMIETLLKEQFGATGNGLRGCAASVSGRIGADLVRRIRYVAVIRNFGAHELEFQVNQYDDLIRNMDQIKMDLWQLALERQRAQPSPPRGARSTLRPALSPEAMRKYDWILLSVFTLLLVALVLLFFLS